MKRILRIFTLSAAMAGAAVSASALADDTMTVGDLPSYVGDDEQLESDYIGDTELGYADQADMTEEWQMDVPLQAMGSSYGCDAPGCTQQGCSGGCSKHGHRVGAALDRRQDRWVQADFLLWFARDRRSPVLAASAPVGAIVPTQSDFGGNIDSGLAPGVRFDAGRYFADGQIGFGGRFWTLFEEEEDFQTPTGGPPAGLTSPTDRNFLVPFQNIAPPPFDAAFGLQVSRDPTVPGPGPVQGNLNIDTDLRVLGSELYGKLLIGEGTQYRLEMLGGYSYFNIRDRLALNARVVPVAPNPGFGTETRFSDYFEAENNFQGGQLGFTSSVNQGRWSFVAVNKVHLGNMEQRVRIDGSSQTGPFNGAPGLVDANRGLFAKDQNFTRDTFTFAPEMNFKLAYRMRNHVRFSVGYSLIYWDSVALAGEQINPAIDARRIENLALADQEPDYVFQDAAFFVQGVDLGVTVDY